MGASDPFFVSRSGEVWACWLDGKPAVNLGSEQNFWMAAEKLFNELHPEPTEPGIANGSGGAGQAGDSTEASRAPVARIEDRHEVTIVGRLYGPGSGSNEVTIFDLSERGCRIEDRSSARPGAHVSLKLGTVGPIQAMIRWRKGSSVGLQFAEPLHPSVLMHIRQRVSLR